MAKKKLPPKNDVWLVREPQTAYGHWSSVIENLTGEPPPRNEATFVQVRNLVHKGVDRKAFDRIRDGMGITTDQLSRIAGIPARTLARRQRFKPDESERLLRIASVLQKGMEVFGSMELVKEWVAAPRSALNGLTPLECCDTDGGAKEVEHLLGRIAHGVFS